MKKEIGISLIIAVTFVLVVLILSQNQALVVGLTVMVVLIALIMVAGNASELLPRVLTAALREIRRMFRS